LLYNNIGEKLMTIPQ